MQKLQKGDILLGLFDVGNDVKVKSIAHDINTFMDERTIIYLFIFH